MKMTRDIRFRGKRVDNSKWVYGFYCQSEEFFDNGGVGHMYREGTVTLHTIFNSANETHLVDPETVGQFTGKYDGNGKEVYAGTTVNFAVFDCFGSDRQYIGEVMWNEEEGEFGVSSGDNYWNLSWVIAQDDEFEAVGTIHDKEAK